MVVLIMGVSGSGKSTVGRALAERIKCPFYDADDFHSAANVAKMQSGRPLTERDREPWVRALRSKIDAWLLEDEAVVLACSALTEKIRAALGAHRENVHIAFLNGSKELIEARMRARDHFMPPDLLDSQFALLEPPSRAVDLDIRHPPEQLVSQIVQALQLG